MNILNSLLGCRQRPSLVRDIEDGLVVGNAENCEDYLMVERLELVAAPLRLLKLTKRQMLATGNY